MLDDSLPPESGAEADSGPVEVEASADAELTFSDNVSILRDGDRTFYIIGTAHVSQDSVEEVRDVIERVKPDTVAIELCPARYEALTDDSRWKKLDIFKVIREGKTLFLLANLAVSSYQRRLGEQLGVKPGAELLMGAETAEETGAHLELVDRDIHITLKRTWGNLGFWDKMKLLGAVFASTFEGGGDDDGKPGGGTVDRETIESLKDNDQLTEMMEEFARLMPAVKEPLIDERDQYLMSSIEAAPGKTVVAVVGAGHVAGMKRWFKSDAIDRDKLNELPQKKSWTRFLKWIIPGIILAAFAFGITKGEGRTFEEMLWAWILPNSIFCAVLTALVIAKPLSIVTAFFASPITSLNPLLGAGMVVGLVEAWLRKPTVEDAENINQDVQSFRGFFRNPFTHVLVVVFASTLGSALGAWVGLGWVLSLTG